MNLGLLFFAVLLIIAGAATGSIFIASFGVLLLVAAAVPSRRGTRIPQRQPSPARPTPQARATPPPTHVTKAAEPHVPPPLPRLTESSQPSATAAVFPSTLFPTLTLSPPLKYEATPEAKKGEPPDEFLTLVALLGLLRLLSKR